LVQVLDAHQWLWPLQGLILVLIQPWLDPSHWPCSLCWLCLLAFVTWRENYFYLLIRKFECVIAATGMLRRHHFLMFICISCSYALRMQAAVQMILTCHACTDDLMKIS